MRAIVCLSFCTQCRHIYGSLVSSTDIVTTKPVICRRAPFPVTFSDLYDHFTYCNLVTNSFKMQDLMQFATVDHLLLQTGLALSQTVEDDI